MRNRRWRDRWLRNKMVHPGITGRSVTNINWKERVNYWRGDSWDWFHNEGVTVRNPFKWVWIQNGNPCMSFLNITAIGFFLGFDLAKLLSVRVAHSQVRCFLDSILKSFDKRENLLKEMAVKSSLGLPSPVRTSISGAGFFVFPTPSFDVQSKKANYFLKFN